jgi:hypothetical protein
MLHYVWQFAATPLLVGAGLGLVWLIYLRARRPRPPDFWKLAASRPDQAYDWFISHDDWVVVDFDQRHHGKPGAGSFVGPFILRVPKLGGRRVAIYGRSDAIAESQEAFVRIFAGLADESRV